MYANLPQEIKEQVIYHLRQDDFIAAKDIHDRWLAEHPVKEDREGSMA